MNTASTLKLICAILLVITLLTACSKKLGSEPLVGADRDAHGCIGSAGYLWCGKENNCVRPWELAKDKGFENTKEDFKRYCDNT